MLRTCALQVCFANLIRTISAVRCPRFVCCTVEGASSEGGRRRLEFIVWLLQLAHCRGAWFLVEKPMQSRMDGHPALEFAMWTLNAPMIHTYLGGFVESPVIPKPLHLITSLPARVHHFLVHKKPKCVGDRSSVHAETVRGWVQSGKGCQDPTAPSP